MFKTKPNVFFSHKNWEFTNINPKLDNITIKKIETDEERQECIKLSKKRKIKKELGKLTLSDFSKEIQGFIIRDKNKIIGWRTYYEKEKTIEGISYALDPDYWGTGLSKYLLDYWIDLMKKEGFEKINVIAATTNIRSIKRLKSVGFEITLIENLKDSMTYLSLNLK